MEVKSSRKVELPDETWLKIIQYLPTKDVFGNMALSCKKLHNLSQDSRAIKYFQVKTIDTMSKYENVNKVIAKSKGLVQLRITRGGNFDNELICQVFESSPRLRTLGIKTKTLNVGTINTIAKSKLEILDLDFENMGTNLSLDGITGLCNINTLKVLRMNPNIRIISTLANNSIPIEELSFFDSGEYLYNQVPLNEFFKSKKDTLKTISLQLHRYDENVPLKNLKLCQNLEKIVMTGWHSKHLDMLSELPNLKHLVLNNVEAEVDTLVKLFQRLSLKKLEYLSIKYCSIDCPNEKEEFFVELSKLDFPVLKKISYHTWQDSGHGRFKNLTDYTLKTLVSKCPNLKVIQLGDHDNLSFKTLMDIFERRNIFIYFDQTRVQFSMEQWFFNCDKNVHEKYQKLKPICMYM